MLKKQGIVAILFLLTRFLLTIMFLLTDALFLNHRSFAAPSYQSLPSNSQPVKSDSQTILSTSYKRYSLCRYDDLYILCEPYTVQRGDWVYKIFRSKGELSKEDFGLFIRIFKAINPAIKNMNNMKIGQTITIPLKKSKGNDFKEISPGVVELPIITLSQLSDASKSVKKPLSGKGPLAATYITSAIPPPATITIPTMSQSTIVASKKVSSEIPIRQLKQFAALRNGQLMMKGKYYFPRDNGDDMVIDVALNPIIQLKDGSRILFVEKKDAVVLLADTIKAFWRDFKIMEFGEVTSSLYEFSPPLQFDQQLTYNQQLSYNNNKLASDKQILSNKQFPSVELQENTYVPVNLIIEQDHKVAVKQLLEITGYKYTPEKDIALSVGNISVKATPGLITRDGKPDILIVFGDIYGSAFEALKKMEKSHIVTISPLLTTMDVAKKIFSALGASTTDNPAFVNPTDGRTISIDGMYVNADNHELFITIKPALPKEAFRYLNEKHITILRVDNG